jgi:hypothetical protein
VAVAAGVGEAAGVSVAEMGAGDGVGVGTLKRNWHALKIILVTTSRLVIWPLRNGNFIEYLPDGA